MGDYKIHHSHLTCNCPYCQQYRRSEVNSQGYANPLSSVKEEVREVVSGKNIDTRRDPRVYDD